MYVGVASVTTLSWIVYKPDRRWARHRVPLAEFIALYVCMYWATYVCRYLPTSLAGAPAVGYVCMYVHMYVVDEAVDEFVRGSHPAALPWCVLRVIRRAGLLCPLITGGCTR